MAKIEPKTCKTCFKEFKPHDNTHVSNFCSQVCYWKDMSTRKGKLSSAWKSQNAKYGSKHKWLLKNVNKPIICTFCHQKGSRIEWANISGEYFRDKEDYIALCHKCHNNWDRNGIKASRTKLGVKTRLFALDFDDTLCLRPKKIGNLKRPHEFWEDKPTEGAVESVKDFISKNIECYVFTTRPMWEWKKITLWLYKNGFPGMYVTNIKKLGIDKWIDDRAITFTNWRDILKLIK